MSELCNLTGFETVLFTASSIVDILGLLSAFLGLLIGSDGSLTSITQQNEIARV